MARWGLWLGLLLFPLQIVAPASTLLTVVSYPGVWQQPIAIAFVASLFVLMFFASLTFLLVLDKRRSFNWVIRSLLSRRGWSCGRGFCRIRSCLVRVASGARGHGSPTLRSCLDELESADLTTGAGYGEISELGKRQGVSASFLISRAADESLAGGSASNNLQF